MDGWVIYEDQPLFIKTFAFDPDNPYYEPAFRSGDGSVVETSQDPKTVNISVDASTLPAGATFDAETWDLSWTPNHLQAGTYDIRFTATDDGDGTGVPATSTVTVPVRVLNINRSPAVEPAENVLLKRGEVRDLVVRALDPEGGALELRASSEMPGFPLPAFINFTDNGDGTATLHMTPGVGDRGHHAIRVVATDDGDGNPDGRRSGEYVFIVSVESDNEPPLLAHLGDVVAEPGRLLQIPVRVSDLDQDGLSYSMTGLPAGATIAPTAVYGVALISWTPDTGQLGTYDVGVTVRDSGNGVAARSEARSGSFRIVVRNGNQVPVLIPVGNQQVAEGELLSFQLRGVDFDADPLSFGAVGLPPGATLDGATGVFNWRPALNRAGSYNVTLAATDGHTASTETIVITVANTNQLPVFVPMVDQLAREGAELRFNVVAGDADADPVLLSVSQGLPQGALFVPTRGEFIWTPSFAQAGEHVITFTAVDPSGVPVNQDVRVRVTNVNRAPVLDESDHTFLIGETTSFLIKATDADAGTALKFSGLELPEGASIDAATGLFSWTPGPGQSGTYVVTLRADDGIAETRQNIVLRASLEAPAPTVHIELTPSFAAMPGQKVLVHAIADSFADITSLKLFVDGTEVPLDANGRISLTATVPGKLNLRAVAVDADGAIGEHRVQLKVRDPADKTAPIIAFAPTLAGTTLRGALDIAGLVQDGNLDSWRLDIAARGSDDFRLIASGEAALDGVLAAFDARAHADGLYTLRLSARDISGRTSVSRIDVEIDTGSKHGHYQRSDTDLVVDLGGMSFALTRQYDSLEASVPGAFGWAWGLSGSDIRIETDVPLSGREHLGVYEAFDDSTRLWVTLPNGERAGFSFAPAGRDYRQPALPPPGLGRRRRARLGA